MRNECKILLILLRNQRGKMTEEIRYFAIPRKAERYFFTHFSHENFSILRSTIFPYLSWRIFILIKLFFSIRKKRSDSWCEQLQWFVDKRIQVYHQKKIDDKISTKSNTQRLWKRKEQKRRWQKSMRKMIEKIFRINFQSTWILFRRKSFKVFSDWVVDVEVLEQNACHLSKAARSAHQIDLTVFLFLNVYAIRWTIGKAQKGEMEKFKSRKNMKNHSKGDGNNAFLD
jgi:hypothetical protein